MTASREREGALLCALAAAGYGAMAVLAKLAYADGVGVVELLALRFGLAAVLLGVLARRRAPAAGAPRRALAAGLGLGAVAYAAEAGLFFAALTRMSASMAELLLYAYPAIVVAGAIALGRERARRRTLAALALAVLGVALVLLGAGGARLDALGAALALAAAAGYAAYILAADTVGRALHPLRLAALVCTGAAASFTLAGAAGGALRLDFGATGWACVLGLALVSTVVPMAAFLAGMERIGPARASVLSTLEPPVTVLLAFLAFGEALGALQIVGGALVLGAVLVLQGRGLSSRVRAASPLAARRASARPLPRRAA
jgi:drug/metabolite transporter (DMT)-like permease